MNYKPCGPAGLPFVNLSLPFGEFVIRSGDTGFCTPAFAPCCDVQPMCWRLK